MKYSIIVPVYNRPDEVGELLESLSNQTQKDFEVIIVEDGSVKTCKDVCDKYAGILALHYYNKENSGPGQSRNYGAERANANGSSSSTPMSCCLKAIWQQLIEKFGGTGVRRCGGTRNVQRMKVISRHRTTAPPYLRLSPLVVLMQPTLHSHLYKKPYLTQ